MQVFADGDDSTVIAETPVSAFIATNTVTVTGLAGFVAQVPNVWTAQAPLAAGGWAFGLANVPSGGAAVYAGLFDVTANAYAGELVALSGVAGLLPDFTAGGGGRHVRYQAMRGQRGRRCAGDGGERDGCCIRCRTQRGSGRIRERRGHGWFNLAAEPGHGGQYRVAAGHVV